MKSKRGEIGEGFFLSEKVGIRRWAAVFIGFVGMLLIVKPAYDDLNIYYLYPVIFCIFFVGRNFEAVFLRQIVGRPWNSRNTFFETFSGTFSGVYP